jgi:hypothetical protein
MTRASMVHTGLIDLCHLKTVNGKSIILAGDNHEIYDFDEIIDMVELIREQEQGKKSIALLVERALKNEHTLPLFWMLESLPLLLERFPLDKTEMKNIEVRAISGAILSLLDPDINLDRLSADAFFQNGDSAPKIMVNDITFQHLYDEYNCLKETLSTHYKKYDDESIQKLFEQQADKAQMYYTQLQYILNKWKDAYGISENEPIISLVKKLKEAELVHFPNQAEDKKHLTLAEKLDVYILRVFIPLFNINAFDHIMQQTMSADIVVLVAGASHARVMKDWLTLCHEADEVLVQSNNDDVDCPVVHDTIVARLAAILHVENPAVANI